MLLLTASSVSVDCAHCGLAVPAASREENGPSFCCAGCRTVYAVIHDHGLGAYYAERARTVERGRPVEVRERSYQELDGPGFAQRCRSLPDGSLSVDLFLEGVHCSACVWLIENLPRAVSGVRQARLEVGRSLLRLVWDPAEVGLATIARTLERLGYPPHPAAGERARAERLRDRALLLRIGIAGFSAGNVMLMAFALYGGAFAGMDQTFSALFRFGSLALALPSVLFSATVFYRGALAALRTRAPHMDLPITIGIWAGFVWGVLNTARGAGEIYFDSLTTLIFLLLVGRFLQHRHQRRAASAAELAQALAPTTARVRLGEETRDVETSNVRRGDRVEVRAGERIPVDGRIATGSSSIDASLLTGESTLEDVALGDRVFAGTTNVGQTLLIDTERSASDTRVGKLIESIDAAQRERAPIVRLADSVASKFVVVVLGLAALTLLVWWGSGPDRAIEHAVALLVVTCPCALGMATPLSVSVALRRAASSGLLFKGGEPLEALARPGTIVFDKTGTLTEGKPRLESYDGPPDLLALAAAVEQSSEHPLAKAIRRAVPGELAPAAEVELLSGLGMRGKVAGQSVTVGSRALFHAAGIPLGTALLARLEAHAARGLTTVLIARNDVIEGVAGFGDELRLEAPGTLEQLQRLGYELIVLSGDDQRVVDRVTAGLPLREGRGGVSPEQKLAFVRELSSQGRSVIMVGDGVNDAAAMSAATVGFAVHGGAEASLLAAHVFSTRPGIAPVLAAVLGARQTLTVIRRGVVFSLAYNAAGVVLALLGMLSPLIAAVLMPLSSLSVVSSALRSRAFGEES
jgi:P-type Cu2+ transporter